MIKNRMGCSSLYSFWVWGWRSGVWGVRWQCRVTRPEGLGFGVQG